MPHVVKDAKPELMREKHFDPDNLAKVISGMYAVVNEGGTGRAGQLPNVKVCGKTGTAQLAATELTKHSKDLKNNAWFVAFAPMEAPEIVVCGLYENGEESFNTIPIVRDVLKAYFDKKDRISQGKAALARFAPPSLLPRPSGETAPAWLPQRVMPAVAMLEFAFGGTH
jgi:penicillin-binding protein 2